MGLTFLVRWFSVSLGAAATTTTAATSVWATRIATTRALTRTGTMALAPAPDIIKVLHGHAPSAYFFAREGYIPFRPAMAGKRKSLHMTGKARAGNRREAPGGARGYGCLQPPKANACGQYNSLSLAVGAYGKMSHGQLASRPANDVCCLPPRTARRRSFGEAAKSERPHLFL